MSDVHSIAMPTKTCSTCELPKALDEFYADKRTKSGKQARCRECISKAGAAYHNAHPEKRKTLLAQRAMPEGRAKLRATSRAYYATPAGRAKKVASKAAYRRVHREQINAKLTVYNKTHREEAKARSSAYHKANREKAKAASTAYRKANRAVLKAKRRAFAKAHPERVKAAAARYHKAHPEKCRAHNAKRRAQKVGATVGDLKAIAAWEKTWRTAKRVQCHWCGRFFPGKACQADHRISLANGGAHCLENLVVSCEFCNLSKHDRHPDEFNASLEQPWLFF